MKSIRSPRWWVVAAVFPLVLLLASGYGGDDPAGVGQVTCTDPGSICSVVGTGVPAYRGEGAPPLSAALFLPIDWGLTRAAAC